MPNQFTLSNFQLIIEYDGTNYAGWQVQPDKRNTLQEVIESTLRRILGHKVKLIGSGRTDAGVHALGQAANFSTSARIPPDKLQKALNALLPADIAVSKVRKVSRDFHSRFQAKVKSYRYTILNRDFRSAFLRDQAYLCRYPLDLELMKREAACLLGKHDFRAFQGSGSKKRNPVKRIAKLKIFRSQGLIRIDIEGDGFLYNMVRNIVGTLVEAGKGRIPPGSVKKILASKDRRLAGPTAPACGLCLRAVRY